MRTTFTSLFKLGHSSSSRLYLRCSINTVWAQLLSFSHSLRHLRHLGGSTMRFHSSKSLLSASRVEATTMRRLTTLHHRLHSIIQQAFCMVTLVREKNVEFHIQSISFFLISNIVLLCKPFHSLLVKIALVVSVKVPRWNITPIVLKLSVLEGCWTNLEFPTWLSVLLNAGTKAFWIGFYPLAHPPMLVYFVCLLLLPLYKVRHGPTGNYIEAFAHLMMDHHRQSSLNKDRRLEDTILELL